MLLPDSMWKSIDANELLKACDDSSEGNWIRAVEVVQVAWEKSPDSDGDTDTTIDATRSAAFKRVFNASGGHHELAAMVSDDFEVIWKRALLGVESPFVTTVPEAYNAHQIPK